MNKPRNSIPVCHRKADLAQRDAQSFCISLEAPPRRSLYHHGMVHSMAAMIVLLLTALMLS